MPECALLLAAGLGVRLRPLTNVIPKCLVPIRGRPLLEYWLHTLIDAGIKRVIINTHYQAALVEAYILRSPWADRVTLTYEKQLLGTGGTLVANAKFFSSNPLFVAHADNLSLFSVGSFVSAHHARPPEAALTIMTFPTDNPSLCGIVTKNNMGLVDGFFEKVPNPPGNCANAAVYLLEPEVLEYACAMRRDVLDLSTEVLPHFVGRMWTWHNRTYHRDIGTLDAWRSAQEDFPADCPIAPNPDPWRYILDSRAPAAQALISQLLGSV